MKKVLAAVLVISVCVSLAGCKKEKEDATPKEKTYTLDVSIDNMPKDYNPHTIEDNNNSVDLYCQMGLTDMIADETGKFVWAFEMAESIKDITEGFQDKEKYGIKEDEIGRVWQIKLNGEAVWEDGTIINADTYISSMKLLLDSNMKNTGAYVYYDETRSDIAIQGAKDFYNNDLKGQPNYALIYDKNANSYAVTVEDKGNMYISINQPTPFWGFSLKDAYNAYGEEYFTSSEGVDYYKAIEKEIGDNEYILVNDQIVEAVKGICKLVGNGHDEEFMEMLYYKKGEYKEVPFEDVGLVKVDDYTFNYITAKSVPEDTFLKGMTKNWIVYEEIYMTDCKEENNHTISEYGTSPEKYKSYGPYKLVQAEEDKLVMTKNESWYGYSDGKHNEQYKTTDIIANYVKDMSKAEQLFLDGKLDELKLTEEQAVAYKNSERIYKVLDTCTYRWIFATDLDKLVAIEKEKNDGTNKKVLYYDDFRKAMSYATDRAKLCEVSTPNYAPAVCLLSEGYYLDNYGSKEAKYRETEEAKKALVDFYEVDYGEGAAYKNIDEAYNSLNGFNLEKAKELFSEVYEKSISEGNYTEGQMIKLQCIVSAQKELTKWEKAEETAVNEMISLATQGTGFEGKISIEYICGADNRYNDCVEGRIEMIKGAWGGSVVSPYVTIGMYTVDEYAGKVQETCGFDPATEELEISYDFDGNGEVETVSKTYRQWTLDMNDTAVYGSDEKTKLVILSNLEKAILSQYQCIPLNTYTSSRIISEQINYGFEEYNILYEYGGVRYITYNYADDGTKENQEENTLESQ